MEPLVTLAHVSVRLGGAEVLSDVSLSVHRGEGLAVVGASGSGKSTLLRVVRGDLWPDPRGGGRRLFHGPDGPSESPIGSRERFALVAPERQDAYVRRDWDVPVEAVIRSGFFDLLWPSEARTPAQAERVREVATALGVADLLGRSMLELSRGEGRKVLLARALVARPELLVLDEPCDGLDAGAREAFLGLVSRVLRGGTAVVLATHRPDEIVPEIRRVVVMEGGRIAREETRARDLGLGRARWSGGVGGREPPDLEAGNRRLLAGRRAEARSAAAGLRPPTPPDRDRDLDRDRTAGQAPPAFRLDRVTVLVEGRAVLRDLSFTVGRGERVAFVGPNGAGKSTLLRLLLGEAQPARGAIHRLDLGTRASALDLRGRIGLVSPELQARHRFDARAEDVVLSGFAGTIGLAEEPSAAERAAAAALLARLGVAHLARRGVLSLSYGELRKVLVARALAPSPEVILLDEPLAGLDATSRAWTLEVVSEAAAGGAAVIAVSHHADELPAGTARVGHLRRGEIVRWTDGPPGRP